MTDRRCRGCVAGLPVHHGIHCGEFEYIACTAGAMANAPKLELVPIEQPDQPARDAWIRDEERQPMAVPFTFGGAA